MINCPKCGSTANHVIDTNYSDIKIIKTKQCRTLHCGHKFFEDAEPTELDKVKINKSLDKSKKIRKTEKRTDWQDFRFLAYAGTLIESIYYQVILFLKDEGLEDKFDEQILRIEEIKSSQGVIYYKLEDDSNSKVYEFTVRGLKANAIRTLLDNENYWKVYNELFKKDVTEEIKAKEQQQFAKSIVHPKTGIKSDKYDIFFLRQNPIIKEMIDKVGPDDFWVLWTKLH